MPRGSLSRFCWGSSGSISGSTRYCQELSPFSRRCRSFAAWRSLPSLGGHSFEPTGGQSIPSGHASRLSWMATGHQPQNSDHQDASRHAPEWVREAWVGLVLPLGDHPAGDPRLLRRFGVTSFWRKRLFPWTAARYEPADFFPVFANKAIAVLQKTQPDAAWWWTENTPHLLHPTARLIFRRDECELES